MSRLHVLAALATLTLAPLLAGCVGPAGLQAFASTPATLQFGTSATSLWPDHQNEPHPMFGWPTLTHPATGVGVPGLWQPIPARAEPANIVGLTHLARAPVSLGTGAGIALYGSLAIVPGFSGPSHIVDISDPVSPKILSTIAGAHRGATAMAFPDGRLFAVFSTSAGMQAYDITNPSNPGPAITINAPRGGHKIGLVPGTPIVYNANQDGGGGVTNAYDPATANGKTEIYDFSDPTHPVLVQEFANGYGCHHIFFWIDGAAGKERAICAGNQVTQIWDIADPRHPSVIVSVPVHHGIPGVPPVSYTPYMWSHFAILSEDGHTLIVGDELNGGGPAECDGVHTGVRDVSGPLGDLWFYDVTDETHPAVQGWFSAPPHSASNPGLAGCTAHHGRLVPSPDGRDLLTMAWYGAGVLLIDFTDRTAPHMLDQWNAGTDTWEAWYDNGYVFTGDLNRGLDVLTLR